jgi:hypothetical protein
MLRLRGKGRDGILAASEGTKVFVFKHIVTSIFLSPHRPLLLSRAILLAQASCAVEFAAACVLQAH